MSKIRYKNLGYIACILERDSYTVRHHEGTELMSLKFIQNNQALTSPARAVCAQIQRRACVLISGFKSKNEFSKM